MSKIIFSSLNDWYGNAAISCVNDDNQVEFTKTFDYRKADNETNNQIFVKKCSPILEYLCFDENASFLEKKDTGILSPGLLFLDKNVIVYEKPPAYQNVFVIPKLINEIDYNSDEPKLYRLPIPWQLYIVYHSEFTTTNVRMHFMNSSLNDINQQMYLAPLTNFYSSGDLCRPFFSNMDDIERYPKNVSGLMASSYDWVWNSGTNLDLTQSIVAYFYQDSTVPEFHKNSLFKDTSSKSFARESFYCSSAYVSHLYSYWENFELHEVSSLNWPKNSKATSFNDDYMHAREDRLDEYISQLSSNPVWVTSECCDNCGYCDDDGEYFDNDNCECSCHYSTENVNMESFYEWAGLNFPSGVSFIESFMNFRSNNLISPFNNTIPEVIFDKLYSQLLYSSQ